MTDTFIGRSLGKYEVESKLGQGGMGMVYRGRQRSLNRSVAIKVLPAQMAMDTDFVERFRQEAQVIATLQHENIVHVYDIDHTEAASGEPIYFIVMEYVDGFNLRQRPDRHEPMSWQRVRAVGLPLARALDYAHRRGIVHRDIKPANVMETRDGKIKLMDFGIAKSAGGVKTATGSVLGTPEYMAPEQAQTGHVTPRSDIYSLGVLLYELASGKLPFEAGEPFAVALKHISEPPEPPSTHAPSIPPWLERLILRAMKKTPDDRFADAAALAHALDRAGADPSSSPSLLPTERPGPPVLPLDLAPTIRTPASGVDPAAPTLETPPPVPSTPPPIPAATTRPSPPAPGAETATEWDSATGPVTTSRRPMAWPIVATAVVVLVLGGSLAFGYFVLGDGGSPNGPDSQLGTALGVGTGEDEGPDAEDRPSGARNAAETPEAAERLLAAQDLLGELDGAPSELDDPDSAPPGPTDSASSGETTSSSDTERASDSLPDTKRPALPKPTPPVTAGPPIRELIRQARRHRANDEYHSLRKVIGQIDALGRDQFDSDMATWARKVDGWVRNRDEDLREEVEDLLDEFVAAVEEEDLDDRADVWGESMDSRTAQFFRQWWQTYRKSKAEFDLQSVDPWDHEADFVAVVRLFGKTERRGDMKLVRTVTWRGRIRDRDGKRMIAPFPG